MYNRQEQRAVHGQASIPASDRAAQGVADVEPLGLIEHERGLALKKTLDTHLFVGDGGDVRDTDIRRIGVRFVHKDSL